MQDETELEPMHFVFKFDLNKLWRLDAIVNLYGGHNIPFQGEKKQFKWS